MIEADETHYLKPQVTICERKPKKTEWAQRGIITEQSFDDYHDALCRTWTNRKQLAALQFGADCIRCDRRYMPNARLTLALKNCKA
jgi:hypothetical protein